METTQIFFIGTYTEHITPEFGGCGDGILSLGLNNITGEVTFCHKKLTTNPSYLTISDSGNHLYAINEVDQHKEPQVIGYEVSDNLALKETSRQPIEGSYPCHIALIESQVFVACYGSGNVVSYLLDENGRLEPCKKNLQHTGNSIDLGRQEGPHTHQVVPHPIDNVIYVPDLGIDKVKVHARDGLTELADIDLSPGEGPRHMVFSADGLYAYVIGEMTGDISCFFQGANGYKLQDKVSTLPATFKGKPSASAIRMHPNGKYLYAGNREYEGIATFSINEGKLQLVGFTEIGGKTLREFNISPNGRWLICALQDSHELSVYSLEDKGEKLLKKHSYKVHSPVCIVFKS